MPEVILIVALLATGCLALLLLRRRALRMRESASATAALEAEIREGNVQPETLFKALIPNGRPILLAIDASGSMVYTFRSLIEKWLEAGREFADHVAMVAFDHELHMEIEPFPRGGGTDYTVIQDYVEHLPVHPRVIVLTDGVAPRFEPTQPDLWVWALAGGDSATSRLRPEGLATMIHFEVKS